MAARKYICPKCKQKTGVNIGYGYPTPDIIEQVERQEIVLGGCIVGENQPDRHCVSCEHEWQIVRKPEWHPFDARAPLGGEHV